MNNRHQIAVPEKECEKFYLNKAPGSTYENDLNEVYKQIVQCRKNIFKVPTEAAEFIKKIINGIARLLNLWTDDTTLKKMY